MSKEFYAGIGSRKTPEPILEEIVKIGQYLAKQGYVLRSGGADGADTAFEQGCDLENGEKEIFLPWKGFNDNSSELYLKSKEIKEEIRKQTFELAAKYHPAWNYLSYGAKCLMARNGMQVLGRNLNEPVLFIVCYSLGGLKHGGTSQALRIAHDRNIPIFNLANEEDHNKILFSLQKEKLDGILNHESAKT
jgi:hypothetical protein